MHMPESIEAEFLAPCGVNCFVCYKHHAKRKPCSGCITGSGDRAAHCQTCAIRECCNKRGIKRCSGCPEFPCAENKRMERNYKKYGISLIDNLERARTEIPAAFMAQERVKWLCGSCGGVVTQHGRTCSECGAAHSSDGTFS